MGTAIVAVGTFAAGANAQTAVTTNTTFGDGTNGTTNVNTLTTTATPIVTINNAEATFDQSVTATGAANGVVGFITGGTSVLTVNSGANLTSTGNAATVTTADLSGITVNVAGQLTASANTETAIDFSSLGGGNGGTIVITGGAGDDGNVTGTIDGGAGDDSLTVNTAGGNSTIDGAVDLGGGAGDSINVTGSGEATFNADITAEDIKVAGTGTVNAGGNVTGAVDFDADGTLNVAGASALSSTLNAGGFELNTLALNGSSTTVTVGGDTVAAKTNNIGNNTLAVTGTFATDANDALNFTIDGATSSGQVTSTGNATINADTSVALTIDTNGFIANNTAFTLVDGNNGGAALLSFAQDTTNDADLVVTATRATAASVSSNDNTGSLGTMLEGNTGDLAVVQGYIQSASTVAALDERAEGVSPTSDGAIFAASAQSTAQSFSATNSRLEVARNGGSDTGMVAGEMGEGLGMWAKAFGQSADQDTREGISGYEADTYGVTVGLDSENIINDGLLGMSFTYANTDVESDNITSTDTDVDSYQLSLYGTKNLDDNMYVSGMVGYAMNKVDQTRNNVAVRVRLRMQTLMVTNIQRTRNLVRIS